MSHLQTIQREFDQVVERFEACAGMRLLCDGDSTRDHYQQLMRQVFHHTRENPQLQALATVWFRGPQRIAVKRFLRHATSEIGHDQLALNDLRTLGVDIAPIPFENPLPATTALLSFGFFQVYNLNPVGYLGYLFFLEFLPTQHGARYVELFKKAGVPREAMTFLLDHTTIDEGHNALMRTYLDDLVRDDRDLRSVLYALNVTGELYGNMLTSAFEQVRTPRDLGRSSEEA